MFVSARWIDTALQLSERDISSGFIHCLFQIRSGAVEQAEINVVIDKWNPQIEQKGSFI